MVQAVPKAAWGKKYLTTPIVGYTIANGNTSSISTATYYRVGVSDPLTTVKLNGALIPYPLVNNFYYEIPSTINPQLIEADKAIMVAQYFPSRGPNGCLNSGASNNSGDGDPEVIYLSPVEQSIDKVIWNASSRYQITTSKHYINVVVPNGGTAISSFKLDGFPVAPSLFVAHPQDPGYSYARINVSGIAGFPTANVGVSHIVQSDSGFNAIAYGYGGAESYGYNAGTNIKDLFQFISIKNLLGTINFPATCRNSPFNLSMVFPYQPTQIEWIFGTVLNGMGFNDTTIVNPVYDSSWVVSGKTLYRYRLPRQYSVPAVGVYPIRILVTNPTPDNCGSVQEVSFDLQVFEAPQADFTFTTNGCFSQPVNFFDNSNPGGRPVISRYWDFGDATNSNLFNPSHTYPAPGTYDVRYSYITDVGCLADTMLHPVVLDQAPTALFTATAPYCVNQPITFNDQSTPGGPASPLTKWTWNFGDASPTVIRNTSTNEVHTYTTPGNYTATLVVETGGGCSSTIFQFPITISADATVTLTSAIGTDNQTVCINNPIVNITYAIGASGNNATVSGLPAGVTGSYNAGVFTISGTPTAAGTFNYTVTATGTCAPAAINGVINITDNSFITLSSPAGSDNQTICINTPISNINYSIGGSGTGASVTGLPAGLSGSYSAGVFTISGTATVSGVFNYTVTTTGPCGNPTATGTVTVTGDGVITLTSPAGTNNQTLCVNTPIATITYALTGSSTAASVSGLPAGVTGNFAAGVLTISGTPTVAGTFNYTVTSTGPCVNPTATGTITVNVDASITLTSPAPTAAQELCKNSTLLNIIYSVGGTGNNASVTGLPPGVTGSYNAGVFTISGSPTLAGVFNYTVTATGICQPASKTGTITVDELPTSNFSTNAPVCETRTISFTDNSTPNTGVLTTWAWNFGDPASGPANLSSLQNPSHAFATAGTYNVSLVVTSDKGCVSTGPARQVVVNLRPLAGFIAPEVCLNDQNALFTDTSKVNPPDFMNAWAWDFGDPSTGALNLSNLQNPGHTFSGTGSFTIQQIAISNKGCRDTINQSIFVNGSFPQADFTVQNPAALCVNDSVSIAEASSVSPGTITKVEIYWDNVNQPGVFVTDNVPTTGKIYRHLYPPFQAPLTKTVTIRYRAYSGGICVNDKFKTITLHAAPKVQFNAIPDICLDAAPYQITQATEIGGVPGTGVFSGPGVNGSGLFNPALAGPGTHTIRFMYASTAAGCLDSAFQTIHVYAAAVADFSVSSPACEKQPVVFTNNSSSSEGSLVQWVWDFGDGSPVVTVGSGAPINHTFNSYGTFNVKLNVVTSNSCRSVAKQIPVTIKPLARPNFSFPAVSCLPNTVINFTNTSTIPDNTESSFSYLWSFGDPGSGPVNNSSLQDPSHTYTAVGPYTINLQVTSGAGCVHDTSIILNSIHPQPIADFTSDKVDVCVGGSITFNTNSNPVEGTIASYNWTMDDGNTRTTSGFTYTYGAANVYNVSHYIINSINCKSNVITKQVSINPYPIVNAGPDKLMLEGGQVQLTPQMNPTMPVTYSWTPPNYLDNPSVKEPVARPPDDKTYLLTVTTNKGCTKSDDVFIKVLKKPDIPNIFSPNGDGLHDIWEIKYLESYPGCTVDIVNRYGQLVYHSVGYTKPWDGKVNGKDAPLGTYYYVVDPKNGRPKITGFVDIIR